MQIVVVQNTDLICCICFFWWYDFTNFFKILSIRYQVGGGYETLKEQSLIKGLLIEYVLIFLEFWTDCLNHILHYSQHVGVGWILCKIRPKSGGGNCPPCPPCPSGSSSHKVLIELDLKTQCIDPGPPGPNPSPKSSNMKLFPGGGGGGGPPSMFGPMPPWSNPPCMLGGPPIPGGISDICIISSNPEIILIHLVRS